MSRKAGEVIKEGFLTKSPPAEKSLAGRKRRYFVLWSNGTFEYYSTSAKKPQDYLKTVDLKHCEDMVAPITMNGRENIVKLTVKQGEKVRDYFLEADNRQEMDEWVTQLAIVCGFSPVEEVDDFPTRKDPVVVASDLIISELPPRKDLQIRPPIRSPSPTDLSSSVPPSEIQRAPMPPPKPKRPGDMMKSNHGDLRNGVQDPMYSVLSPTEECTSLDAPQQTYEDMGFDEEELNRNPPPVWKPPQPSEPQFESPAISSSSILYSRVEARNILPRTRGYEKSKNFDRKQGDKANGVENIVAPFPPPRSKAMELSYQQNKGDPSMGIGNDRALITKLQQKQQELSEGDVRTESVSSFDPMENYEEVCFDLANTEFAGDRNQEEPVFNRVSNMTLPPRRHNIGSEIAMMQCPPESGKAQEYLSFQPSPAHSPHSSTSDLLKSDSNTKRQSLSPKLRNPPQDVPHLPPRGAERMRGKDIRKSLPRPPQQNHNHIRQNSYPESLSQEDLHQLILQNKDIRPRPVSSSSLESPPPVPFRKSAKENDVPRRSPIPPPFNSEVPEPPPRNNRINRSASDGVSPPPVPTRRQYSGQSEISNNLRHCEVDDTPPVPSRGAREKINTNVYPRTQTTSDAINKPKLKPKPAPRLPSVERRGNEISDGVSTEKVVHRLAPPVSNKPRPASKPVPPAKPKASPKPVTLSKPLVSAKPTSLPSKPQFTERPPLNHNITIPHQTPAIPPPLPPR